MSLPKERFENISSSFELAFKASFVYLLNPKNGIMITSLNTNVPNISIKNPTNSSHSNFSLPGPGEITKNAHITAVRALSKVERAAALTYFVIDTPRQLKQATLKIYRIVVIHRPLF